MQSAERTQNAQHRTAFLKRYRTHTRRTAVLRAPAVDHINADTVVAVGNTVVVDAELSLLCIRIEMVE